MPTRAELMGALRKADAAGDVAAAKAIARRIKSTPAEEAPAAAPEAVAPAAAPPGAFSQVSATGSSTAQDVPWYQGFEGAGDRFKTAGRGIYHSLKGTGRAARQIGAYLTQDEDWQQKLQAEEAAAREELAGESQGFKDANLMGNIFQTAIPAGAGAKLGLSAGGGLARIAAAEGLVGGGMAALNPTTKDENRGTNMAVGTGVGIALPVLGRAAANLPVVRSVIGNTGADRVEAQRAMSREIRQRAEALKASAGKQIQDISATAELKLQPLAKELKAVRRTYGDAMDQASAGASKQLDELIMLGKNKGVILKDKVRELRTAALRAEDAAEGTAKSGFEKVRQLIDRGIDEGVLPANVDKLRKARTTYRTRREIAEAEALRRGQANPRGVAALRAAANAKATQDRDELNY